MKILAQKRDGNLVTIEVEAEYALFQKSFAAALVQAGKEVKLPGFRPGKAPADMIERALNREYVEHLAAQDLIAELYPQLIDLAKIEPIDYPNIEVVQQAEGKPFVFKAKVEVYPTAKLGNYKGLKLTKQSATVTEDEVIHMLGHLQERFAAVKADGEKELLPLDDEFAKKVSRYGTLAELKAELQSSMLAEKKSAADADLKNQAVTAVGGAAEVEIPKAMIDRELEVMLDELRSSLAQSGLTLEDYLKGAKKDGAGLRQEMAPAAETRVRGKVVLKTIAETEQLAVSEEEFQAELKALAESSGEKLEELTARVGPEGRGFMTDYLLRQKALDFIIEKAKVKAEEAKA
jgi:FKBP-type peptidyl-prolyl cis-trans isomerase (trigger factor)